MLQKGIPVLFFLSVVCFSCAAPQSQESRNGDATTPISRESTDPTPRTILVGMTKQQVIDEFGPPDDSYDSTYGFDEGKSTFTYFYMEDGQTFKTSVEFDRSGKVENVSRWPMKR